MQQPVNMSGAPVTVSVETAPIQIRKMYIPVTSESARQFKRLGVAHIVIGALIIPLQFVSIGCADWVSTISSNGLWIGSQFIVTGVFGIYAGRTGRKCQVVTFHVLSTISAGLALILLCTAAMSAVFAAPFPSGYMYFPLTESIVGTIMETFIAVLAIAEGIVAIRSSVIGCTIGACCCKCRGSCCCPTDSQYQQLHNSDELDLSQQQFFASSQQEPTFNTNQEQPVLNQHQQQLMFNPGQKQLALNPNQQPSLFNPNQQQLMFNPNQQQIMLLPTQPNVGFYPQHQDVQYYAFQPIIVAGSHQTDVSTINMSGATGQGQDTGPLTELIATPLIGDNTGTSGANDSDKGQISSDDVEMLSP